ncbi:prolipoprotein diacylglyceryl transferase [Hansschlegelia zhihuaiae]|uniref:Phosphatidylglycerol--prolipoprotein diacylglyceryl transferase n=1 Tax=Hansschlegelia zhihuaiae TaxID=405005 RepID=A0A4Q0MJC5_9HYPH|nr:prolipoprotein diacylglyceryl transferase [Hansschlegelia zhihuaiae]RXF73545.1 prolipoprotein diacylglyceryl transferase [Hansschlegelia zhihuaiae]
MPLLAIPFPMIDPVAVAVGPIAIRWYALAYIAGLLIGWWLAKRIAAKDALWGPIRHPAPLDVDDLIVWVAFGVILGGRVGYVLFYDPAYFAANPLEALKIWHGGMSFHGGFLGAALAIALFARSKALPALPLFDLASAVTPVGLFFGRIANFVNGELFGRAGDVPWAMVFPHGGPEPRHPSQLYQAALEGIALLILVQILVRMGALKRPGLVGGAFVAGYGVARIVGEQFREPDAQIGFLAGGLTMGMLLSIPMLIVGLVVMAAALRRPKPE